MSSSNGEEGFTEVRRKGRKKKIPSALLRPQGLTDGCCTEYAGPDVPLLMHKIASCRQELKQTQFYTDLWSLLASLELSYLVIVCYGIGHIGTCHIARHQFALLVELNQHYKPRMTWLYDPVLHEQEREVISQCGCHLITTNQHCKYSVEEVTLFFMPHCGKAMYNNLLWANWSVQQLSKMAIIGNSFNSYHEKLTSAALSKEAPYLYHIRQATRELPFPSSYMDGTMFNDTSLHLFPLETLLTLDSQIWNNPPEPIIDPSDPEIIL